MTRRRKILALALGLAAATALAVPGAKQTTCLRPLSTGARTASERLAATLARAQRSLEATDSDVCPLAPPDAQAAARLDDLDTLLTQTRLAHAAAAAPPAMRGADLAMRFAALRAVAADLPRLSRATMTFPDGRLDLQRANGIDFALTWHWPAEAIPAMDEGQPSAPGALLSLPWSRTPSQVTVWLSSAPAPEPSPEAIAAQATCRKALRRAAQELQDDAGPVSAWLAQAGPAVEETIGGQAAAMVIGFTCLLGLALVIGVGARPVQRRGRSGRPLVENREDSAGGWHAQVRHVTCLPRGESFCETMAADGQIFFLLATPAQSDSGEGAAQVAKLVRERFREAVGNRSLRAQSGPAAFLEALDAAVAASSGWRSGARACLLRMDPGLQVMESAVLGAPFPLVRTHDGRLAALRDRMADERLSATSLVRSGLVPLVSGETLLVTERPVSAEEASEHLEERPGGVTDTTVALVSVRDDRAAA